MIGLTLNFFVISFLLQISLYLFFFVDKFWSRGNELRILLNTPLYLFTSRPPGDSLLFIYFLRKVWFHCHTIVEKIPINICITILWFNQLSCYTLYNILLAHFKNLFSSIVDNFMYQPWYLKENSIILIWDSGSTFLFLFFFF